VYREFKRFYDTAKYDMKVKGALDVDETLKNFYKTWDAYNRDADLQIDGAVMCVVQYSPAWVEEILKNVEDFLKEPSNKMKNKEQRPPVVRNSEGQKVVLFSDVSCKELAIGVPATRVKVAKDAEHAYHWPLTVSLPPPLPVCP